MSVYCERCQVKIEDDAVRYLITIHATPDFKGKLPAEGKLSDLEAVMRMMDKKSGDEIDHDVYQSKAFTLCAPCKEAFMKSPLNSQPPSLGGEGEEEGRVH